jgi:hypothetical protein
MSAAIYSQIDGLIGRVDETVQISFAVLPSWISFLTGYLIYPLLIFITNVQPMKLRHISDLKSFINII